MFCQECGVQLNEGAAFCPKCGTRIDTTSGIPAQGGIGSSVGQTKPVKNSLQIGPSAKSHKKTDKVVMFVIGISIVLLLFVIKSLVKDENTGSLAKEEDTGEAYEEGCLDFTTIISQCEYCETPLNTLVEFCDLGSAYGFDEDKINACSIKKYNEMQHNCTADVIQVENVPYVYRACYGTYSGDWQGAGPAGTGTFVGKPRLRRGSISYTGEWKYGLPEGEGELYIENFLGTGNDLRYKGQMSAGLRHGTGYMYEYAPNPSGFYRVYGETVFQNDILSVETQAVTYDADTGELIYYIRLIGTENGDVAMTARWGANELSPEAQKVAEYATLVALGYLAYSAVKYYQNLPDYDYEKAEQESIANLEQWRAQKEADLLEQQEREAEQAERTRQWYEDKYYDALYNDPTEYYIQTRNYKYNAGLGW